MNSQIFKSYDIRGIYPEEVNEEVFYKVGRSVADYFGSSALVVGRDARSSGPKLKKAAVKGINEQGVDVRDIGLVSSDQFYWTCADRQLPGIMITASHNPAEYGGCKMVRSDISVVGQGSGMEEIERSTREENWVPVSEQGQVYEEDTADQFVQHLLELYPFANINTKVVIDTGNGASGPTAVKLAEKIPGLEASFLFNEPDGSFPNRGPDPLKPGALDSLAQKVKESSASLGLAFDGDGDRLYVLDEDGELVMPDLIGCLLAEFLLGKSAGGVVVVDPTISRVVYDTVEKNGGRIYRERVGHSFIKKRMREKNAVFGCEKSGHYYFSDLGYADSDFLAMLLLLLYLSESGITIKEAVAPLRKKYPTTLQLSVTIDKPAKTIMDRLTKEYSDAESQDLLDGLTVSYPDWWFNVRPSNTEPKLRLVVEAHSPEMLENKKEYLLDLLQE